jgi:hypothetical protein
MKQDKNIFETVTRTLSKKKAAKSLAKSSSQPKEASVFNKVDNETQQMLNEAKQMHDDLEDKINYIKKNGGVVGKKLQDQEEGKLFLRPDQWEAIQQAQTLLGQKLGGFLKSSQIVSTEISPPASSQRNIFNTRKGKTLGNRKKWIPVK